jgi:hypothetical protein
MAQERILAPQLATYNISFNLSSISSFFSYPSRLLARIRKYEDISEHVQDLHESLSSLDTSSVEEDKVVAARTAVATDLTRQSFPGPWGFFTSGYMLGLVLLVSHSLILNFDFY